MIDRPAKALWESGNVVMLLQSVANGTLLRRVGNTLVGVLMSALLAETYISPIYGTGADGDVVLGSNTTLTRSMEYEDLDLAGFTIDTAGFMIRGRGEITGAGTIRWLGSDGIGLAGASLVSQALSGGSAGGNGRNTAAAGVAGVTGNNSWPRFKTGVATQGQGGAGGASGGGQAGGAGGTVGEVAAARSRPGMYTWDTGGKLAGGGTDVYLTGGTGGGGGGSDGTGTGGGGGSGGGVVAVLFRRWNSPCVVTAPGGNGAAATGAGNAGGGGGGGGGFVYIVTDILLDTPTLSAPGGSGGPGVGTGSAGSNGNDGATRIIVCTV